MADNRVISSINVDDATDNGKIPVFNSTTKVFDMGTAGSGSPGGLDTEVQYNNSGAFGGASTFTYNDIDNVLTVPTLKIANDGVFIDENGNEYMKFAQVTSAVNYITFQNADSGNSPKFIATGDDTDVPLGFKAQGSGSYDFYGESGYAAEIRLYEDTDNGTNYTAFKVGTQSADLTYTLPTAYPSVSGYVLTSLDDGTMSWQSGSQLTPTPADGVYSGTTMTGTAGAALAFGDLIYLDPTDSRWELTDANSALAADGDARGIIGMCVLAAAADGDPTTILLYGTIRADTAFPTMTINSQIYVSETAGDITGTQPTTSGCVVRVVGQAITADTLLFNPSPDYITLV